MLYRLQWYFWKSTIALADCAKNPNYSNAQVRLHMQLSSLNTNLKYIMVCFVMASES